MEENYKWEREGETEWLINRDGVLGKYILFTLNREKIRNRC